MTRYRKMMLRVFPVIALVWFMGCGESAESTDGSSEDSTVQTEAVGEATASQRRRVRVETIVLEPTSFQDVIEVTGTVEANNDAVISAQASGTLVYRVERGTHVRQNGLIAQIDSTLMYASFSQSKAQVDAAQAQYDLALDTYERQEPLFRDSIISAIEFENVRAQMNQAAAQLNQSKAVRDQFREQLDNTSITAPFAGTVETYMAEVGEQVMPGAEIVRVVSAGQVKITTGVPERYANDIEPGAAVKVALDAYGGGERDGSVSFVGRAINRDNRTFPAEIRLDNSDLKLKPEMVARVFLTRNELSDVLVIPQDAVPLDEEGHSVFVVTDQDGERIAERRRVVLGPSYGGKVVVEEGLEAGDEVVVIGQYNLTEGDAVEIANEGGTAMAVATSAN